MNGEVVGKIVEKIHDVGGNIYFTGGCVRDELLGLTPKDIDLEVYGIWPSDLHRLLSRFGNVTTCGESFGVFKLGNLDIAVPRKEKSTARSHTTLEVDSDPFLAPEVACRRRDFTWNAMLKNAHTGEILDFHHGRDDLHFGIVRAVDPKTFMEDPLRLLRAAKFASRYRFIVAHQTATLVQENRMDIRNLPLDRIFGEVSDILMEGRRPSYGFKVLDYLGLLEVMLPEIWVLRGVEQSEKWHPEGDAFKHTCRVIDYDPVKERTLIGQLARLYHDTGKVCGSLGHEKRSKDIVRETFPLRLTNNQEIIDAVSKIVGNHMALYGGTATRGRVKRLASKVDVPTIVAMCRADKLSRPLPKELLDEDERHINSFLTIYDEVQHEVQRIILGRDIQSEFPSLKPGPIFKTILDEVYEQQLDDVFSTHEDGIVVLREVAERVTNGESTNSSGSVTR